MGKQQPIIAPVEDVHPKDIPGTVEWEQVQSYWLHNPAPAAPVDDGTVDTTPSEDAVADGGLTDG